MTYVVKLAFVCLFLFVSMFSGTARAAFPIQIDVGDYDGFWDIFGETNGLKGDQTVQLDPGSYFVRAARRGEASVVINVDANGNVTSNNTAAMTASGSLLTFNTTTITIDPGAFNTPSSFWDVFNVTNGLTGVHQVTLVPNLTYIVRPARRGEAAIFFNVEANGDVSSQNSAAVTLFGSTLTFNTVTINVEPSDQATWRIFNSTPNTNGAANISLVPGGYFLSSGGSSLFTVANPCAVNPNQLTIGVTTFDLTCGASDSDEDGVPDDTDNCPDDPNPDQIDQDLDGFGNVCDPDLDGDLVGNLMDNCPEIANADQSDLDTDGVGDVCDGDDDNDSVPDLVDNCPIDENTDQADNDNDLFGDVCDEDDDNDTVADLIDNCPLTANADQADFDGNGQGDVCDGDIDGDNVANAADLCPLTPQGTAVNVDGCSGPQFIALSCVRENFVQHGQYVSCVAHAANDAVSQGLLTPKEKARFVKQAAKK